MEHHPRAISRLAPAPPASVLSFPNTSDDVHIGLAFDHSPQGAPARFKHVDYVFGADFADWQLNMVPGVSHNDSYVPFDTDAYPQSVPGHSLADWKATHPSWIVYRCDRKTPAYYGGGDTNVPLDFSNPAVQRYQLREVAKTFARGATGVGFDNFTFSNHEGRCGVYRNGKWTRLGYPGVWQQNARYDEEMMSWLRNVRLMLRREYPGKTLAININFYRSGLANVQQAARYVDLVFDESGFTAYGAKNLSGSRWQEEVDALEYLNRIGRAFDVNGIVNASSEATVTPAEINWVLGNYLLVKGAHSYTYIYAGDHDGYTGSPSGYGGFYDRPQYHVKIGYPVSARRVVDGLQVRYYSGGLAIVNPSATQTLALSLGGEYRDMFGGLHRSVTLGPTSAIVLLGTDSSAGPSGG